jgi:hypothetical protein
MLQLDTAQLSRDLRQLNYKMQELENKTTRKMQRAAITSAARYMAKQIRNSADLQGGNKLLKKSITHKVWVPRNNRLVIMGIVGQNTKTLKKPGKSYTPDQVAKRGGGLSGRGKIVPIHFTISRIKPHTVTRERGPFGGAMRWEVGRSGRGRSARIDYQFSTRSRHPGIGPRKWFYSEADSTHATANQVYYTRLKAMFDREVAKLAKLG